MEKVLVTGAGGFIGSHLCKELIEHKYYVKAFVRYNSRNSRGWLEELPENEQIEIIWGDIRNYDIVRNAMKDVDIVFHLASLIGIPYSYHSPDSYVDTNIRGTLNILQAAKDLQIKKVVHTSTSEIYGTAQFVPITENHPVNPQSPYAATKAAADFLALSFYRSFDLPVAIIRPFNTYGPKQSTRAVIPAIITQILGKNEKIKLGSLSPTRDLTYVKDTVDGFIKIAEKVETNGQIINIASNFEISIGHLVKLIANLMEVEVDTQIETERQRPEKSEVERLWADIEKAKSLLGWLPKYSLEKGLKETIQWFRTYKNLYKEDRYTI
jgi:NAD dependent epimerase/dehydratase